MMGEVWIFFQMAGSQKNPEVGKKGEIQDLEASIGGQFWQ